MSRRIVIFAFVAGTALMVGPVSADQECFDSTCIAPAISEVPSEPVQAPAELADAPAEPAHALVEAVQAPDEDARAAAVVAGPADAAARSPVEAARPPIEVTRAPAEPIHPLVEVTQAPAEIAPAPANVAKAPATDNDAAHDLAKMPVVETRRPPVIARKLPPEQRIYPKSAPEPRQAQSTPPRPAVPLTTGELAPRVQEQARVASPRPRYRYEPAAVPAPLEAAAAAARREMVQAPVAIQHQVAVQAPLHRRSGSPNVVVVAPPIAEDGTIAAYPAVRPDPNWKLCQIDQRTGRQTYCTSASYHPYGEGGYRPMGTYRGYRTTPGYVTTQPDARVISLEQGD